jgi:hypothetical protein
MVFTALLPKVSWPVGCVNSDVACELLVRVDHGSVGWRSCRPPQRSPWCCRNGTVASGDHCPRRPPPESLIDPPMLGIDHFEHFLQPSGRQATPLCYPSATPFAQMQQRRSGLLHQTMPSSARPHTILIHRGARQGMKSWVMPGRAAQTEPTCAVPAAPRPPRSGCRCVTGWWAVQPSRSPSWCSASAPASRRRRRCWSPGPAPALEGRRWAAPP